MSAFLPAKNPYLIHYVAFSISVYDSNFYYWCVNSYTWMDKMAAKLCIMLKVFTLLGKCTVKSRLEVAHEKIRSIGNKAIFLLCLKFFCKILL